MLHLNDLLYLTSLRTLVHREVTRFLRMWVQTLLPPLVTTLLYFLIFGQVMGEWIQTMHGFRYITYITPGLIMVAVITNAFTNVSSSLYSMRFQKSIEEILIAPMPNLLLLLGFVLGGVARGFIIGGLVTALALCFTSLPVSHPWVLLAILPSAALLFSLAGFINAIFAKSFDDISMVPNFILTPLTYLGGVFYPISALPPFWQKVSLLNPFVYIINVFRYALLGVSDVPVGYALLMVWLFCALLIRLNAYLLKIGKGLRS
jgi:ABC-2 type transport system permease protein